MEQRTGGARGRRSSRRESSAKRVLMLMLVLGLVAAGCGTDTSDAGAQIEADPQEATTAPGADDTEAHSAPNVVDIVATGHAFDVPAEIPAGWTTFRLHNNTAETHFALFGLLPEGRSVEDSKAEVAPVFQDAMDLINAGDPEAGFAEFANLPAWFEEVTYMGGPGFVGPGGVAETTIYLEPGIYAVECYVKSDGVFHTTHGMITQITVTGERSQTPEPEADVMVTVSSERGIEVDGDLRAGVQTIAVHFEDQTVHGNVLGHDVHLVRIDDDTDLAEVAAWMNWIGGLEEPAPAQFLGGAHDMPAGHTAYVTVDLSAGDYAFIAEVDDPDDKNMLIVVNVP